MTRSRSRTLLIVVGIAAGTLIAGIIAGTRITSPADAAARTAPPEPGPVTVPVELRELESAVVTRGDASYTGAVDVAPELAGLETAPVITGQVPDVGDEIGVGDVLIEIAGRPVLVLPGEIPMYRTLRPGMTGPDVAQLEQALDDLGFDPGSVDDTYTSATGRAVRGLFEQAGYPVPSLDAEIKAELDAAEAAVRSAEDEVHSAESGLAAVSRGPREAEKIAAQNDVDQARRALADAEADGDKNLIADAKAHLALAEASQRELLAGPDTTAEQAALSAARDRLAAARADRDVAAAAAGTPLPVSEVVFVPSLPRRVDEVHVRRGETADGVVMSISGAGQVVTATVDAAARELLDIGMSAVLELPDGDQVGATLTEIAEAADDGAGYDVTLEPDELTAEQTDGLRSANVRVTIPVANTAGAVLAVPLAALTAGPSGEARVEVMRPGASGGPAAELVTVRVGLTAEGYAEVEPLEGELEEGELVVVGHG